MASCPFTHALNNGVSFCLLTIFTFAPRFNKSFTTASFPLEQALNNGISSYLLGLFNVAPRLTK